VITGEQQRGFTFEDARIVKGYSTAEQQQSKAYPYFYNRIKQVVFFYQQQPLSLASLVLTLSPFGLTDKNDNS
jgi:hypothetical protein